MAGTSFFSHVRNASRLLAIITALAMSGCGQGDGPVRIPNSPATPLPPLPVGFCDPINFEVVCDQPGIVNFNGGATVVVDNPDKSGINESDRVARMQKFSEETFGGTRLDPAETPIDFSAGEAFRVKVWSERSVPVTFKLEETTVGVGGRERVQVHTGGSTWQELCYDFSGDTPVTIAFTVIFDNGVLGQAIEGVFEGDWTFYYDDITQVRSCNETAAAVDPDAALYRTTGDADLVIPDDYSERTPLASGSVINDMFADDETYSPVLAVSSGTGSGANVAQVGFIGFDPGFLTTYESIVFKAKGLPNAVIFVKLVDAAGSARINLTSSGASEELVNGWFQVEVPLSAFTGLTTATGIVFESDDTAPAQFTMLLTDVGFTTDDTGVTPPPTPSENTLGVFSEEKDDPAVTLTDPGFSSIGNPVTIESMDTSITPFEGTVSLGLTYSGTGANDFGGITINIEPEDVTSYDALKFAIDTSGIANFDDLTVQIEPPGAGASGTFVSLSAYTGVPGADDWVVYEIPLSDFSASTLTGVEKVGFFNARDAGGALLAGKLYLDDIHFTTVSGGGGGPVVGNIVPDGDFENGMLVDPPWKIDIPSGAGVVEVTTAQANGGIYSARISASVPASGTPASFPSLKVERIEAGNLSGGESVTVSFDAIAVAQGPNPVPFFVELFSETMSGATAEVLFQPPDFLTDSWTSYTFDTTLGADATGGVSLLFKADCGGTANCELDVYIDNVAIVIN